MSEQPDNGLPVARRRFDPAPHRKPPGTFVVVCDRNGSFLSARGSVVLADGPWVPPGRPIPLPAGMRQLIIQGRLMSKYDDGTAKARHSAKILVSPADKPRCSAARVSASELK